MTSDITTGGEAELRQKLVNAAVRFLTNSDVIFRSPQLNKEKFLRSKGLTDSEIRLAVEKASELINLQNFSTDVMLWQSRRRSWLRDNVLPVVIYGGFAYGCYWFYKNCLRSLLFVERPKTKSTSECLEEVRVSLDALSASVETLRGELHSAAQTREASGVRSQLDNIKSDIASVKGILLNRNQFPSLKARSEAPSIPAWQRASEAAPAADATAAPRTRNRRSESGGSNSSEGEQATKNSDSSLEIM